MDALEYMSKKLNCDASRLQELLEITTTLIENEFARLNIEKTPENVAAAIEPALKRVIQMSDQMLNDIEKTKKLISKTA